MKSTFLINSLGIGGAIFAGLVLLWFLKNYLKKRMAPEQPGQGTSFAQKAYWEEKRRYPRLSVSWPASLETAEGRQSAQLKDVSLGGAFVVCPEPLLLKQKFHLTLTPPQQQPLMLTAEVVWSNVSVPRDKVINRGMGVRFIQNTKEDRRRLNAAIQAHLEDKPDRDKGMP